MFVLFLELCVAELQFLNALDEVFDSAIGQLLNLGRAPLDLEHPRLQFLSKPLLIRKFPRQVCHSRLERPDPLVAIRRVRLPWKRHPRGLGADRRLTVLLDSASM
jgi:hypothetical protein